jgi:hypothetical protein
MFVYLMAIWSILRPFGIFCAHSGYFMVIWYIFPVWHFVQKNLATLVLTLSAASAFAPINIFLIFWRKKNKTAIF